MSFRCSTVVFAAASLFSAATGAAFAGTPYTLTDLGVTASGGSGYVDTYNGNVVTVGYGYNSGTGYDNAWYWTKASGAVNVTPLLPAGWGVTGSTATGVNSSGQIVGMYYTAASGTQNVAGAYVYTIGGTAQQINLPSAGFITTGVDGIGNISEGGSVPLYYGTGFPPGTAACPAVYNVNTQAFTYPGGSGTTGTGFGIVPEVINANGWIGGEYGDAFVWNGIAWSDIPPLSGTNTDYVYGMNSDGDIVGKANTARDAYYVPYNGAGSWGSAIDLFSGTTKGVAYGINDSRMIVGATGNAGNGGAYIWTTPTTGSGALLSTLVTPSALNTWSLSAATGIDNAADILGWGTNPGGTTSEAFLLTPALPGDANLDGQVDINDLTIVLAHYGQTGMAWTQGEFTGDGTVDINDLTIVLAHYGQSAGAAAADTAAVPEPSALLLSAAALAGLATYAWRRRK